jgi:hypothetical protein
MNIPISNFVDGKKLRSLGEEFGNHNKTIC